MNITLSELDLKSLEFRLEDEISSIQNQACNTALRMLEHSISNLKLRIRTTTDEVPKFRLCYALEKLECDYKEYKARNKSDSKPKSVVHNYRSFGFTCSSMNEIEKFGNITSRRRTNYYRVDLSERLDLVLSTIFGGDSNHIRESIENLLKVKTPNVSYEQFSSYFLNFDNRAQYLTAQEFASVDSSLDILLELAYNSGMDAVKNYKNESIRISKDSLTQRFNSILLILVSKYLRGLLDLFYTQLKNKYVDGKSFDLVGVGPAEFIVCSSSGLKLNLNLIDAYDNEFNLGLKAINKGDASSNFFDEIKSETKEVLVC